MGIDLSHLIEQLEGAANDVKHGVEQLYENRPDVLRREPPPPSKVPWVIGVLAVIGAVSVVMWFLRRGSDPAEAFEPKREGSGTKSNESSDDADRRIRSAS